MCNKIRHYHTGALTIAGRNYKNFLEHITIVIEDETDGGEGVGMTTIQPELTKTKSTIDFTTKLRNNTGKRYSMLQLTVYDLDGDLLGVIDSGSIEFTTTEEDDSAGAEQHECAAPGRTSISFDGTIKIVDVALYTEAMSEEPTSTADDVRLVNLSMTIGGLQLVTLPVRLNKVTHEIPDDKAQIQNISGTNYGAYTNGDVISDDPVLTSIATGSGVVAFSLESGANLYENTDGALITKATFDFANRKLNTLAVSMSVRHGFDSITAPEEP